VDIVLVIRRKMTAKEQQEFRINQRYLFFILEFELFYSKNQKIRGGGFLPKLLNKSKEEIKEVIKKYEIAAGNNEFEFGFVKKKPVNSKISLRIRGYKESKRREIVEDLKDFYEENEEGIEFDKVIPDLIIMKY